MSPSDTQGPLMVLEDVHLRLGSEAGEVHILRGVDFEAGRGETISIVGPSGSGKTSMMMVAAGLERATSGTVMVDGHDFATAGEDELALLRRDRMGIVFQSFHLVPTMSALENVAVPLELAGRSDAFDRAGEMLAAVGLDHRLSHYPGQLSGGEQQRTALARAFAVEPGLLLADEPTGNLDHDTGEQIIEQMFGLCERFGTTLMLITHDPGLAARCERMVTMQDGMLSERAPAARKAV
ncbi:MAG: ATP-binding cassette domain-containing protein [Rhodospirillales bacterium]